MSPKKNRYAELKNMKTKPSDYLPGRYEQLTIDNLIIHEPDQSEISSFMDEFYAKANSLNAATYSLRHLALNERSPFALEMCKRFEELTLMVRCLASAVEEMR